MNSPERELWFWPRSRFARAAIIGCALLLARQACIYVTVHTRDATPLADACRYLQSCEVCVNKGGTAVCARASYVDSDTALRVAWFRACERAIPHPDTSRERAALGAMLDPPLERCESRLEGYWRFEDAQAPRGFFMATEAERRCATSGGKTDEQILNEVDGYVREVLSTATKRVEAMERNVAQRSKLAEAERKAQQYVWRACLKALPRYSAECTPASDALHVERAKAQVPEEVLRFGRTNGQ